MSIERLFKLTQKQAKIDEFVENLKKNPKQVSEYKKLVLNGGLEANEIASMIADIPQLKDKGFIIDDIKISWEDHKKNTPKNVVPIKKSHFKSLAGDDFKIMSSVKFSIYDDMNGAETITHYSVNNGLDKSYGNGEKPYSVNVVPIDAKNPEDIAKFNNAQKSHNNFMNEWNTTKRDILENRGTKYTEYMKLDPEIIEKEKQTIETQKKAEYQQWLKDNQPPKIFSKPTSQIKPSER